MSMQTYNTTRAQAEGELRAEVLKQLLSDVPDHAVVDITVADMDDPRVKSPRWWFTARWPVERDYVAEAQAERDREDLEGREDLNGVAAEILGFPARDGAYLADDDHIMDELSGPEGEDG